MYTFIDVWHRRKGTRSTNEYVHTHSTEEYVRTYVRSSEGEDVEQEGDEKDEEEDKKEEKGEEEDHPVGLLLSAVRAPPRTQSNAESKRSVKKFRAPPRTPESEVPLFVCSWCLSRRGSPLWSEDSCLL